MEGIHSNGCYGDCIFMNQLLHHGFRYCTLYDLKPVIYMFASQIYMAVHTLFTWWFAYLFTGYLHHGLHVYSHVIYMAVHMFIHRAVDMLFTCLFPYFSITLILHVYCHVC